MKPPSTVSFISNHKHTIAIQVVCKDFRVRNGADLRACPLKGRAARTALFAPCVAAQRIVIFADILDYNCLRLNKCVIIFQSVGKIANLETM